MSFGCASCVLQSLSPCVCCFHRGEKDHTAPYLEHLVHEDAKQTSNTVAQSTLTDSYAHCGLRSLQEARYEGRLNAADAHHWFNRKEDIHGDDWGFMEFAKSSSVDRQQFAPDGYYHVQVRQLSVNLLH